MSQTLREAFQRHVADRVPTDPEFVPDLIRAILAAACESGASDVHLIPGPSELRMTWRIDGVLHEVAEFPRDVRENIVARLKIIAELLTYRTDVPQEGRIRQEHGGVEMRVSTFPTLYGEKAVIRLFVGSGRFRYLEDLGFHADILSGVKSCLQETGGVILATGPAGSGKTTTAYACLRELAERSRPERSLVSLEDPIEAVIPRVAQSQIKPAAGFDYQAGLKSLLRQDPEVILVGEIRDRATAEIVFQASLTGHLVLTTFHAGSAAEAVGRLLDMGLEPYQLRSGILAVINQRLVRRLCACARVSESPEAWLGLDVEHVHVPAGCPECGNTGYRERIVVAEMLRPGDPAMRRAILSRSNAQEIERLAVESGMVSRWERATSAVAAGLTSPQEVRRVLGFR
jgi:type II secretory ATPase GspE/PulE/Tfp pilus assembly ATPase PilB-like protein